VRQVYHLWPHLPAWLARLPDSRFQPFVDYSKQFLLWEGCPPRTACAANPPARNSATGGSTACTSTTSDGRHHEPNALEVHEQKGADTTTFAWITNLSLAKDTVIEIAEHGGHGRWIIENQGFNYQKNSGLNMEHAYSHHPDGLKIFYTLLQIAHMIMQLLVKGSPLKNLAGSYGQPNAIALFGSLKNIPRRLLECLRNRRIPDAAFDPDTARHFQIRFATS